MSRKRLKKIIVFVLAFIGVGLAYGAFVQYTGWGIPCPVFSLTGLRCPGCGVTHMCMALLKLDLGAAFAAHPVLFVQLPFLTWILVRNTIRYVLEGQWQLTKTESAVIYICIALLLVFSIVRNAARLQELLEML